MWRKMELHRAARKGESEKLQRLLERGSYDVNEADPNFLMVWILSETETPR
jgi:hypothetical protein